MVETGYGITLPCRKALLQPPCWRAADQAGEGRTAAMQTEGRGGQQRTDGRVAKRTAARRKNLTTAGVAEAQLEGSSLRGDREPLL